MIKEKDMNMISFCKETYTRAVLWIIANVLYASSFICCLYIIQLGFRNIGNCPIGETFPIWLIGAGVCASILCIYVLLILFACIRVEKISLRHALLFCSFVLIVVTWVLYGDYTYHSLPAQYTNASRFMIPFTESQSPHFYVEPHSPYHATFADGSPACDMETFHLVVTCIHAGISISAMLLICLPLILCVAIVDDRKLMLLDLDPNSQLISSITT